MLSKQRTLLRLHVEAVWGVQLPPLTQENVELLSTGHQPTWKLYTARMDNEQISIWRPDVPQSERAELQARLNEALTLPAKASTVPEISREIAFQHIATPATGTDTAQKLARILTPQDLPLLKVFDPDYAERYFQSALRPLVGTIVNGRLLSLAHSSRRTAEACELGIETSPEARRRGYALAATLLWTTTVAQEELVPIYSALASTFASLALAHAAGYRAVARAATIEGQ